MGDIAKNINTWEVACKCGKCEETKVSRGVLNVVQMVRDHFGATVSIHCGVRCEEHNELVGGSKNSQHLPVNGEGHAIDFHVVGEDVEYVYDYINKQFPSSLGLGVYETFVHVDDRADQAYRWKG